MCINKTGINLDSNCAITHKNTQRNHRSQITGVDDLRPSSAKRKRSGLGSIVRLRFPSSPLPSLSTLARSIWQKSIATSSSRGRKRFTGALIITSLLSSRRSDRHSSPFLWREDLEWGIEVDLLLFCSVIVKQRNWVGKKTTFLKQMCCSVT